MSRYDISHSRDQSFTPLLSGYSNEDMAAQAEPHTTGLEDEEQRVTSARAHFVRALALLCACLLSVGSHYASYILSPLKSRLSREMGTSNTEFSLLISAFSLNSTWTPLIGGLLASKLGTTRTSILATGVIFIGQALLLIGDLTEDVRLMAFGMFTFGLGVSPLAVVQETIIVRYFKSHGLGISMALGLVAGKGASFVSAHTSYPLTQKYGPHAPFYAATFLSALSVIVNFIYILASKWLIDGSGAELEATDIYKEARLREAHSFSEARALKRVAEKRKVHIREITKLGDNFWAYIGINVLCGALWSPFTHLAANIIEQRYNLTELDASNQASYVLAGSLFLYPICGLIVDRSKHRATVIRLFMLSSVFTMIAYIWLVLPPSWTKTAIPAVAFFGIGVGFSPLLLVVIVPQLVPHKYVSTTLGAHKSLEQAGSTIFQTLAGLALDIKRKASPGSNPSTNSGSLQRLLNTWLVINVVQLIGIKGLGILEKRRKRAALAAAVTTAQFEDAPPSPQKVQRPLEENPWDEGNLGESPHSIDPTSTPEQRRPLLPSLHSRHSTALTIADDNDGLRENKVRRGKVFAIMSVSIIVFAWVLFMGTAWLRLRSKEEREGSGPSTHRSLF